MLYEEFDEYIFGFATEDYDIDYWYDEGTDIAENMLIGFDDNDWKMLLKSIPERTVNWKKRIAYCMHDGNNLNQLMVLLRLVDTDDDELFEISVDSLRGFTSKECLKLIQNDTEIIFKIKELYPNVGEPAKRVFEEFLKKLRE